MPGITNAQDNLICENKILNNSAESGSTMPFFNSPPGPSLWIDFEYAFDFDGKRGGIDFRCNA